MPTSAPDTTDAEHEAKKRRALKLIKQAAAKAERAHSERTATWRYAAELGASTREIAEADGDVSHMTVQRTLAGGSTTSS